MTPELIDGKLHMDYLAAIQMLHRNLAKLSTREVQRLINLHPWMLADQMGGQYVVLEIGEKVGD